MICSRMVRSVSRQSLQKTKPTLQPPWASTNPARRAAASARRTPCSIRPKQRSSSDALRTEETPTSTPRPSRGGLRETGLGQRIRMLMPISSRILNPLQIHSKIPNKLAHRNVYIRRVLMISMDETHNSENRPSPIATYFITKQTEQPGYWDSLMLNSLGEPYNETVHGPDPLGNGFSYCAPWFPRLT